MPAIRKRKLSSKSIDLFGISREDIAKLLKGVDRRSWRMLVEQFDKKLSELRVIRKKLQEEGYNLVALAIINRAIANLEVSRIEYQLWVDHLKELDERQRNLNDQSLEREKKLAEDMLERAITQLQEILSRSREDFEKAKAAEALVSEEFLRRTQEIQELLAERERLIAVIEENNKILARDEAKFRGLKEGVKTKGLLERIKADNPQIDPQKIDDAFDKIVVADGRKFSQFAEGIGISSSKVDRYVDEAGLRDEVTEMDSTTKHFQKVTANNSELSAEVSQTDTIIVDKLLINSKELESQIGIELERNLVIHRRQIELCPKELLLQGFQQKCRSIDTLDQELSQLPSDEVRRRELVNSRDILLSELNSLLRVFAYKFTETSDEYLVAKSRLESLVTPEGRPKSINVKRSIPLWMMTRSQGGTQEVVQPSEPLPQQDRSIPTIRETQVEPARQLQEISDQAADTGKPKEEEEHDSSLSLESINKEIERLEADIKLLTGQLRSIPRTDRDKLMTITSELKRKREELQNKKSERDTLKSQTVQGSVQTPVVNVDDQDRHGEYP